MAGIKIQINSLEALERLIGGNDEVEVEIRNSVVQTFTNKHLLSVAKELDSKWDEIVRKTYESTTDTMIERVQQIIKETMQLDGYLEDTSMYMSSKLKDTPEFRNLITDKLDVFFNAYLTDKMTSVSLEKLNQLTSGLDTKLESKLEQAIQHVINQSIIPKIKELLTKPLADILSDSVKGK